jgi:hypothetical protein
MKAQITAMIFLSICFVLLEISSKRSLKADISQSAPFQARARPINPDNTPIQKNAPKISFDSVESQIRITAISQNQTGKGISITIDHINVEALISDC